MTKPQAILHPRRILAVSLEDSSQHLSRVIQELTGNKPEPSSPASSSLAGTTHDLHLQTPYYTATVPVWLDLVTTASEWAASFLSPEAREVLEVLGGVVVVFPVSGPTTPSAPDRDLIREVGRVVREGLGGWEWDGVSLGVGVGQVPHPDDLDVWDEVCGDAGLEFVHVGSPAASSDARNEFGEKMGISRVLEALESGSWDPSATAGDDVLNALGGDLMPGAGEGDGIQLDLDNLESGFHGAGFEDLKQAMLEPRAQQEGDDRKHQATGPQPGDPEAASARDMRDEDGDELGDHDVQKVVYMMQRLQAVKDMNAGLPEDQRKRMAAKAVGEVMREL